MTETEMPVGALGEIYPLLDPQSKSEVGTCTGTEVSKVAEPAVTPLLRNQFVPGLTGSNKGEVNSVDPVGERERELQEYKDPGIKLTAQNVSNEIYLPK